MRATKKMPAKLRPVAAELARLPGVVGVFWGAGRTAGTWGEDPCLSVHVRRKGDPPRNAKISREYHGYRTDVLLVGDVRYHSVIDTADEVSGPVFTSSITGIAVTDDKRIVTLLSGHGTLKATGDSFESGPFGTHAAPWVHLIDDHTKQFPIELMDGLVSSNVDFALGTLLEATLDHVLLGHQMSALPFEVRKKPLAVGDRLTHFSSKRGRTCTGQVVNHPDDGTLHDGVGIEIDEPIVVRPLAGEIAFSVEGDSGSLVFDDDRHAVGFVVAGASNHVVSYLMPITRSLQDRMANHFPLFFEVPA